MPKNKYSVLYTARATNDLLVMSDYTTENHSRLQSKVYNHKLRQSIDLIAENPYIGEQLYPNSDKTRILKNKHHSIIYDIGTDTIKIRAIPHNSRMITRKIPQELKRATPKKSLGR